MLPQNFEKVKDLMGRYTHIEEIITKLNSDPIIRLTEYDASYKDPIMTIGTHKDSEHPAADVSKEYVINLIKYYEKRLTEIKMELSQL